MDYQLLLTISKTASCTKQLALLYENISWRRPKNTSLFLRKRKLNLLNNVELLR